MKKNFHLVFSVFVLMVMTLSPLSQVLAQVLPLHEPADRVAVEVGHRRVLVGGRNRPGDAGGAAGTGRRRRHVGVAATSRRASVLSGKSHKGCSPRRGLYTAGRSRP